jgi:hypothetical protein
LEGIREKIQMDRGALLKILEQKLTIMQSSISERNNMMLAIN